MKLHDWLNNNSISFIQEGNAYIINNIKYYHIHHKEEKIFDEDFRLIISEQELSKMQESDIQYVIYYFGSKWYYSHIENQSLSLLKYLGRSNNYDDLLLGCLGVHGKYEILNGTRDYNDWCKKAKFLGYTALGICEKHTLGGSYYFQQACKNNGIKSIIGESLTVDYFGYRFEVKLYVKNELGWKELLKLHKIHNIDNHEDPHIKQQDLLFNSGDLYVVIHTDTDLNQLKDYQLFAIQNIYYQLDFTEFKSNQKDKERLLFIKQYNDKFLDILPPILINDCYYLDSEDYKTKILVNEIGKTGFQNLSSDQYMKTLFEIYSQASLLFKEGIDFDKLFQYSVENVNDLISECDFEIKKTQSYLPKYKFNEDEKGLADNAYDLFLYYINIGFEKKVVSKNKDQELYFERLNYEIDVLLKGDVIDYFLILKKDVFDFCKENDILTGIGRGSSAGSLVAYLLNIVEVDPIEHGLIFERFLNEGRLLKGTLPDIDSDVPSEYRVKIIDHIRNKYGRDNVAFIGTAQLFKLKSLFKDLIKYKGESFQDVNKLTSIIGKEDENEKVYNLFKLATNENKLKGSLNKHSDVIELIDTLIFQPRSFGIHAAGLVIVPDNNGETIYDFIPTRIHEGNLITEWEKDLLEDNGFLKLDLLGLTQLDKIMKILYLIKENKKNTINILDISLEDKNVFELFQKGLTEDVFQFGTEGLKNYCKELKPDNINDLIAANALYRPGTMDTGMHKKYIAIKNGDSEIFFDVGTQEATKDTYGIAIYQEQIMKIFSDVAGFSLVEADDVRKYMGKKDKDALDRSKGRFISGGISNGFKEEDLDLLWEKLETFSRYGFNRSHSAAYSITGYYTQWLKCYYPLEFYTVALEFSNEDSIGNIISEISLNKDIKLQNPNINKSLAGFSTDQDSIYWGLLSIKYVGQKAVNKILEEKLNGKFYSFSEFIERCSKFLDKRVLTNLILTGCFDELEKIKENNLSKRINILQNLLGDQQIQELIQKNNLYSNIDFILIQKDLCGYGFVDFNRSNSILIENISESHLEKNINIYAILQDLKEFNTKNGVMAKIELDQNGKKINCVLWSDAYLPVKDYINKYLRKPISLNVVVKKDGRTNKFTLQTNKFSKINFN